MTIHIVILDKGFYDIKLSKITICNGKVINDSSSGI